MNEQDLASRHPKELPAGTPTLTPEQVQAYLTQVPPWQLAPDGKSIRLERRCRNFMDAVELVNRIARLAEEENHHPDLRIHSYRFLEVTFSTHSIGGLSDNDFIMAAKLNELLNASV